MDGTSQGWITSWLEQFVAMADKASIEHAITVFESQRLVIDASVVDTTIAALREQLYSLTESDAADDQRPPVPQGQRIPAIGEAQFIGRDAELRLLQDLLRHAVVSGDGHIMTVRGDTGIGKSRLIHEFVDWTASLPREILVLRGRGDRRLTHRPYALIQDLLATHFGIKDSDAAEDLQSKLESRLAAILVGERERLLRHLPVLSALFGLSTPARTFSNAVSAAASHAEGSYLGVMVELLKAWTASYPAVVALLEDAQWADDESLALAEELVVTHSQRPFLVISMTRSQTADRSAGLLDEPDAKVEHQTLVLPPLSDEESRRLVTDILGQFPEPSQALLDFVVERGQGNPLHLQTLASLLVADGRSDENGFHWHLRPVRYSDGRVPLSLISLIRARFSRLSAVERITLQRAAVLGDVFWDRPIIHMGMTEDSGQSESETLNALNALEGSALIRRQPFTTYADTQEYAFDSPSLQAVAYESLQATRRQRYHRLAADWLAKQSSRLMPERLALIAEHYQLSAAPIQAAELFEVAASRAWSVHNLASAIDFTREALSILVAEQQHAPWQASLQEQLGEMLRRQARLVEATQSYLTMEFVAREDGELGAQVRALNGAANSFALQGNYEQTLEKAEQATRIARLTGSVVELAAAHLHQAEAYRNLGDMASAEGAAQWALEESQDHQIETMITKSLGFLCSLHIDLGNQAKAANALRLLGEQSHRLQEAASHKKSPFIEQFAAAQVALGTMYRTVGKYEDAVDAFHRALELLDRSAYFVEIGEALDGLGQTAFVWGNASAATVHHRRAVSTASSIGHELNAMGYRTNLAETLIEVGKVEDAVVELDKVLQLAEDSSRAPNWVDHSRALCLLTRALLRQGQPTAALTHAIRAKELVHSREHAPWGGSAMSLVWRTLGTIAASMPLALDDVHYDAPSCYSMSIRILQESANVNIESHRALIETYLQWAAYEDGWDDEIRGNELRAESRRVAQDLEAWLAEMLARADG